MILDRDKFLNQERPYWAELETQVSKLEVTAGGRLPLEQLERIHYLYERASAGLAKLKTGSTDPATQQYLESLVARAYGEIHATREQPHRLAPFKWFIHTLPQTFRRHARAFWLATGITIVGMLFGGGSVTFDPEAKDAIVPQQFSHLMQDPADRVAREESQPSDAGASEMTTFSAQLMTNNIGVSLKALALGITFGIGTILILFYNGVILGLVVADYVMAGQSVFLAAWLLPHGSIEIPAILMGGQAGLVLAGALIGWGNRQPLSTRMRRVAPDLVTLIGGIAVLLVWAGVVEAFFSQYHAPVMPYSVKIAFGMFELLLLILFLWRCGRNVEVEVDK